MQFQKIILLQILKLTKVLKKNKLNFKICEHDLLKKNNIEGTILAQENLININLIKNRFKKIIKVWN